MRRRAEVAKQTTNPRWEACCRALERPPTTLEFMVWVSRCWRAFAELHGCKEAATVQLKLGEEAHRVFDEWLLAQVQANPGYLT